MAASSPASRPSPERIFNTLSAYQQTAALRSGVELDVFTRIDEGYTTPDTLAAQIGASSKGVRVLCDFLTIMGYLEKYEGRYSLTPEAALFLSRNSHAYMGTMIGFLANERAQSGFAKLTEAVKRGGTAMTNGDNRKPNDEIWVSFARSMAPLTVPSSLFIANLLNSQAGRPCRVLDIAAGHGMYGITVAKQNPAAQVTALGWPPVLEVARENAEKHGVASRYSTKAGSVFETDLGTGYDFILLTNIFHHFDPPTCERLMRRVYDALKPGGYAVTLEFVPNEDRVTPPTTAAFSMNMLTFTDDGDAYTFAEYSRMFENAGFAKSTLHPVPEMPEQVILTQKPA